MTCAIVPQVGTVPKIIDDLVVEVLIPPRRVLARINQVYFKFNYKEFIDFISSLT